MKLNDWSVVRSPNGISAKHLTLHDDIEICVSIKNGKLSIGVHRDGYDKTLRRIQVPIKAKPQRKPKISKPSFAVVEAMNLWHAERSFNQGKDQLMWLYLFSIEFYKGESNE